MDGDLLSITHKQLWVIKNNGCSRNRSLVEYSKNGFRINKLFMRR